ncbi:MAG TPA: electron transfer flavoprotein subunit beta/FixA family protein, partial [Acidimicrobiales bacterium]|nr:electron transfer flavoprotein subunit beta/FixA family protein [Acidimicrobiales bacterium]
MRIAVLVKQVPRAESMELLPSGRIQRDGVELEMNAYCRRAVSKGVELARDSGGSCTVFTLGPPSAEDVLREAVGWGADEGVLLSDPQFAGSDTLATARALAAALDKEGPWDLVLVGRNSIDADTGQVGPELAELLGLPFAAGVRELAIQKGVAEVRCELDDGWRRLSVSLPAVLSTAERLTEPCKVAPEDRVLVQEDKISRLAAVDLGFGPWGQAGSPTTVGRVRVMDVDRRRVVLSGPVADQVSCAVDLLWEWGALDELRPDGPGLSNQTAEPDLDAVGGERHGSRLTLSGPVESEGDDRRIVCVVLEPDRPRSARELL